MRIKPKVLHISAQGRKWTPHWHDVVAEPKPEKALDRILNTRRLREGDANATHLGGMGSLGFMGETG